MTKSFVSGIERFTKEQQIPVVQFHKGRRKDDVDGRTSGRFAKPEALEIQVRDYTERIEEASHDGTLSFDFGPRS
jgi:hypothetical protein